jgi:hypothetical protein
MFKHPPTAFSPPQTPKVNAQNFTASLPVFLCGDVFIYTDFKFAVIIYLKI